MTVVSRQGCSACEVAAADVARICADVGASWRVTDVDGDPDLRAEYGDRVPVILVDGEEHGYWQVEEDRLRAALAGQ